MRAKVNAKNFFLSSTFWGIVLFFAQSLQPDIEALISTGRTTRNISSFALSLITAIFTMSKAVEEGGNFYTPKNIPGKNKEDIVS